MGYPDIRAWLQREPVAIIRRRCRREPVAIIRCPSVAVLRGCQSTPVSLGGHTPAPDLPGAATICLRPDGPMRSVMQLRHYLVR
jgi:hypothetical protein